MPTKVSQFLCLSFSRIWLDTLNIKHSFFFASLGVVKSPANIVEAGEAIPHFDVNRGKSQSHNMIKLIWP
jgi:hypothetical protein